MKNKKILVTGADGFIGSHLCEELIKLGANVKALAFYNSFDKAGWIDAIPKNCINEMEIVRGDVRDAEFVETITKNIDIIFHLAALIAIPYSYYAPRSYIETNVIGTLNVLQSSMKCSCERIINTSTSEVYGSAKYTPIDENHILQAQSPYAASKIAADHLVESFVKSFNLPALIIRPFNTYGPRQSERAVIPTVIRQIIDPRVKTIKVGDTSPKRDFNYVLDTVNAFISLANANKNLVEYGVAYNAGSGQAVSIEETINIISKISNNNKPIKADKRRFRPKNSEVKHLVSSSKKLQKLSGWKPKISLNEGLSRTINWWREKLKHNKIRGNTEYSI